MYTTLRRIREEKAAEDRGFTLIELLVVVVIIGILVAIAIPLYLNYRHGAENKSTQSDVRNAAPLVEQYAADHNGVYPDGTSAGQTLAALGAHTGDTTDTLGLAALTVGTGYCITGHNSDTSTSFYYSSVDGKVTGTKPAGC